MLANIHCAAVQGIAPHAVKVEVNDGFALGLYPGCPPDLYARMMVARWDEICARA